VPGESVAASRLTGRGLLDSLPAPAGSYARWPLRGIRHERRSRVGTQLRDGRFAASVMNGEAVASAQLRDGRFAASVLSGEAVAARSCGCQPADSDSAPTRCSREAATARSLTDG